MIKAMKNRVIIVKCIDRNASLIYIPDQQSAQEYAIVISKGPGCKQDFKKGDCIIIPPFCGAEIVHEGMVYFSIEESDIDAVIEK
ncbi:MAG: co-chaperone GroES [Anaerovoracaceae bacterium]